MLNWESPLTQSILGTLFTWAMTALGALGCLLHYSKIESRKLLDGSLGFSAGVMLAASYWSLLSPAEDLAVEEGYGSLSFIPLTVGLVMGSAFVFLADKYAPVSSFSDFSVANDNQSSLATDHKVHGNGHSVPMSLESDGQQLRHRREASSIGPPEDMPGKPNVSRRLLLMMIAITIHNIPEGLAVGVAFGAVGQSKTATISKARNLALGIGIQNFPEGLAVSLPLKAAGLSLGRSVWYGQLSGLVEPLAGFIGCLAVQLISPILPYALSFAAGAMIYVVFDDIIPEAQQMGNGHLASICAVLGFVVMMCLDMGLG
uniref:Zinc transporter ZIP11 n=1 Tax=Schmidtea mediterranea TaxID=79327 RepID=A0A0H3YJF2_SCHMD|nr:slc39a-6 [Schmidtea mediterranea]